MSITGFDLHMAMLSLQPLLADAQGHHATMHDMSQTFALALSMLAAVHARIFNFRQAAGCKLQAAMQLAC